MLFALWTRLDWRRAHNERIRDDYRQSLASGLKVATDRSYHGGSFRGGYGHGLAADLVSVNGETDAQRWIASEKLWNWIDAHPEFGIGRPYLDKDPAHVAPIDGKEYADHRKPESAMRLLAKVSQQLLNRRNCDQRRGNNPGKELSRRFISQRKLFRARTRDSGPQQRSPGSCARQRARRGSGGIRPSGMRLASFSLRCKNGSPKVSTRPI
jgi:hypothetical protein